MRRRHKKNNPFIVSIVAAAGAGIAAYTLYRVFQCSTKKREYIIEDENIKIVKAACDVLLHKIGVTQDELDDAILANKTAFDLVKEKGFSKEQLANFINHQRFIAIDELVLNRKISREIGEQVKEKIKEHTESWEGKLY